MPTQSNNIEYPEELQEILEKLLGSTNVYFQPPSSVKLFYPCIVYQLDYVKSIFANDKPYNQRKRYLITYISKTPDQFIPDKIGAMPMCSFNRFFIADNLNHYTYRLYFDARPNN